MNIFEMNQRAFPGVAAGGSLPSTPVDVKPSPVSARRRGRVFQVSKKPSNVAVFLVSFLSYLVGIFPSMVFALPTGGTVQAGSATINQPTSQQMIIQQTTDKAIIDWQEFGIGSAEHVDFQLSQGGTTLNRVTGNNVSQIFGKLTSNGDLWLINPNGILFGATAQVDVRGLLATTSDISNADFLSSNYNFGIPSSLSSTVVNQGSITAAEGGLVALVAPGVQNMGIITARLGKVSLASGKTFTVDLYGDQLINLGVDSQVMGQVTGMDGEVLSSLVTNSGSVFADGGLVRLDVNAAQGIVDRVINMDGVIQAHSVSEQDGTIILSGGEAGEVHVTGTLDASGYGEGETGGTVHVLGDMLAFYDNGLIDVSGDLGGGTLLFGGDYQGQGLVPNATDVFVGSDTQTFADAVTDGNGGKMIFWADRRMRFYGIVKGRGGKYFGDGGFVEVSGKEELYFDGFVDTTAANGKTGTLLLDPEELTIAKGSGPSTSSAATFDLGGNQTGPSLGKIFEATLEGASQTTNVVLLATNSIVLGESGEQISLDMQQGSGNSVTFKVTDGTISFSNTLSSVSTQGGEIIFDASGSLSLGSLTSNGGNISLTGSDLTLLNDATRLTAGTGNINITEAKLGDIGLGNATCTGTCGMTISNTDLGKMSGNKLIINGSSNNGAIYVDGVTQTTSTFSGGVELKDAHISGTKGGIFFQGASTFSTLKAESVNGMEVNANLTTTAGALTLDGDSNNVAESLSPKDNIIIASGVTLTSASDISLSATTGGISAAGALTLTAPSSITLTGDLTATGAVDLTANSGITLNNNITSSSSLNIDANSSTLSLASGVVLSSAGALTLAASDTSSLGSLTLTSTSSTININSALTSTGAVDITANSGLFLNNSTLTGAGNITLQGGSGLTLVSGMGITSSAGNITLGASGGSITANGALTLSSNGSITISNALSQTSAGSATLNANSGITLNDFTANGAVILDADLDNNGAGDFTISSGTLSTTNNALTVTANDLILTGILDSGTGSTTISVSDGDSLSVGFTGTGMSLDDATELAKIQGTGDINLLNGNIVVASGTTLSSSGKLTLGQSGGTVTGQGALTLTGANGLVITSSTVSATGSLTLNATTGGITTPGAITLNATDGITISDIFTSAGATTIDADTDDAGTGTFTLSSGLSTGSNALSITAVDLALNGTLDSGNAGTTILASQSTNTIGLGVATGNNMTLDNTDLGNIIANSLTIGDGTNGNILVDGVTTTSSDQFGSLTLNATDSASSVTFGAGDSTFQGLTVNAGDGITLSSNLITNGTTTFNSDSNGTGTGSFTINSLKTLNTNNNALTITSKSMSLNSDGAINSGNAGTTLQVSQSGDTIGLGGGAGTFSVSSNDLAQITAIGLTIGSATNGTITVDGVTSTSTPLTLIANSGTSAVNFSSNASSFNNLTLEAGTGGVSFGSDLSAADLNVTSGGAIADTGTLTITGTSSFTADVANQAITLNNTSNLFTGAVSLNTTGTGDATLTSNNAVTLSTSTVGGDLDVTVGGDNSLNVTGAGSAGGAINLRAEDDIIFTAAGDLSANGNITVKADNDLDANGTGGALTMVDGTVFNAGSGTIELSADEDITLGRVETSSSSDAAVTLTSTSGGAVDGDTAVPPEFTSIGGDSTPWLDIDAANGRLVAEVAAGFGAENAIETKVQSLDIANSTSGGVDIFEFDDLDIFKINNAGGSSQVSFEGDLTGQANCSGTCLFVRRDIRNALIGNKTLDQLTNASNEQLKFDIFELNGQNFFDKTPVDHVASSPNGPFTADLFSEKFELVELAAGTDGKFDGMEVSQSFWGGAKPPTLEVAEWKSPDKKNRSRQRSAKRKKRVGKKVDDTASITLKKPIRKAPKPRIQTSESGYLGFAP